MDAVWLDRLHKAKVLGLVVGPLLGTIVAVVLLWNRYVFVSDLVLFLIMYLSTLFGITVGYHRMLTHRSFEPVAPVKAVLLILGCMAFEGGPLDWAATHLKHHDHADHEDDPHSPIDGFWHAHFGWLFNRANMGDIKKYVPHLLQDPVVMFVNRYMWFWFFLSLFIPFALGGWTALIWAGAVRTFWHTHVAWSVNSVCHLFGRHDFATPDQSKNNWIIGLLGGGEGWHNNHHAFPYSAFHGLKWWQFDPSGYLIRALEWLGLAHNVQRVPATLIKNEHDAFQRLQTEVERLKQNLIESIENAKREFKARVAQLPTAKQQLARLNDIRQRVVLSSYLDKASLQHHLREVQQLLASIHSSSRGIAA